MSSCDSSLSDLKDYTKPVGNARVFDQDCILKLSPEKFIVDLLHLHSNIHDYFVRLISGCLRNLDIDPAEKLSKVKQLNDALSQFKGEFKVNGEEVVLSNISIRDKARMFIANRDMLINALTPVLPMDFVTAFERILNVSYK